MFEEYKGYVYGDRLAERLLSVDKLMAKRWQYIEANNAIISLTRQHFLFGINRKKDKNSQKERLDLTIELFVGAEIDDLFEEYRSQIEKLIDIIAKSEGKEGKEEFQRVIGEVLKKCREKDRNLTPVGKHGVEPGNIEKGILDLRQYGVVLQRQDLLNIKRILEDNYYTFKAEDEYTQAIDKESFEYLFGLVCEYIAFSGDYNEPINGYYDINVNEFAKIFDDKDVRDGDLTNFKKRLARQDIAGLDMKDAINGAGIQKIYIDVNKGRTDRLVRQSEDKKPVRCISFYAEKIKDDIERIKNTRVIKNGDKQ